MGAGSDPDADDETPGLQELFGHYDALYFRGALPGAGFSVERAAPRAKTISSFGYCSLGDLSKITLYKPMPRYRTDADLKNALLHLMIHGIIFLKRGLTSLGHGPAFRDWMDAINTSSIEDYARPTGGYCITTTHDFSQEKSCNMQGFLWKCDNCGNTLVRAKGLGSPSDSCCIENVSEHPTCDNMLCHWHNHKKACPGKYVVTKPAVTLGQKMAPKGTLQLLTGTTKMSKSQQGAVQQSDEVQENSSLKKTGRRNIPEDFEKAIVVSAAPRRKPKHELVAWAMREHLLSNNAKSPGSSSSKKADDSQKAIALSAAPRSRRPKRKRSSVTSEEQGFFSPGRSCNNANSPRRNTSRKEVQRSSVQPCASQKKPKLGQGMAALEKHVARPAATRSTLKQPAKTSSSRKSRKQHQPEDFPRITAPLTRSKRKQSNRAAPERQAARSEARGSAKEKEYVCFSLWQNFHESECSSGSAEPLVNKRTVRRRRERERLVQRARSRSIEARPDEEVSSGQTEPPPLHLEVIAIDDEVMAEAPSMDVLAPAADQVVAEDPGAGGQSQPPAPSMGVVIPPADHGGRSDPSTCMDIAVAAAPADQVMTRATVDQSQPPALCSIAADQGVPVPPRSADPPGLTPPNPRSWPAVIDISDDDDD